MEHATESRLHYGVWRIVAPGFCLVKKPAFLRRKKVLSGIMVRAAESTNRYVIPRTNGKKIQMTAGHTATISNAINSTIRTNDSESGRWS